MKNHQPTEEKFNQYLEGHKKIIVKVASVYSQPGESRKDLIQDIILQMWKAFPKYDESFAFSTWTYRIALNVSISSLRKEMSRSRAHESYALNAEVLNYTEVDLDENLQILYQCIETLKPIDKAIVIQLLDGCKHKEISLVTGISESNVATRVQRIKSQLKDCFTKQNHEKHGI